MPRDARSDRERIEGMSEDDLARVNALLRDIGGPHVNWGAASILDVWVAESRMESERRSAQRLALATWALVGMTLALVLATVGLIVVTVRG